MLPGPLLPGSLLSGPLGPCCWQCRLHLTDLAYEISRGYFSDSSTPENYSSGMCRLALPAEWQVPPFRSVKFGDLMSHGDNCISRSLAVLDLKGSPNIDVDQATLS